MSDKRRPVGRRTRLVIEEEHLDYDYPLDERLGELASRHVRSPQTEMALEQPRAGRASLVVLAIICASILLMVFKGFDVLLQAAHTPEGSSGVAHSIVVVLRELAPFLKAVLGGGVLAILKAWWDRKGKN